MVNALDRWEMVACKEQFKFPFEVEKLRKEEPCGHRILAGEPLDQFLVEPLPLADLHRSDQACSPKPCDIVRNAVIPAFGEE